MYKNVRCYMNENKHKRLLLDIQLILSKIVVKI